MPDVLKAPFPWFGGKSRAAALIWPRLGNPRHYIEPFAGSLAVLLARPTRPQLETINDLDALVANFWRATQAAAEEVATFADHPINEADLHSRHLWLVEQLQNGFREHMLTDPLHYDPRIAGWWAWGLSCWIGGGWCAGTSSWDGRPFAAGEGARPRKPHLVGNGGAKGVHRQRPHLSTGEGGKGIQRRRPGPQSNSGFAGASTRDGEGLVAWFSELKSRLRRVRVCCGDWRRVVTPAVLAAGGERSTTAVLLDPPYSVAAGRAAGIYATDSDSVAAATREWAIANGDNPRLRIALCGYGEHEMPEGWEVVSWRAGGGYGSQDGPDANRHRERIWFSPHCHRQPTLFDLPASAGTEAASA